MNLKINFEMILYMNININLCKFKYGLIYEFMLIYILIYILIPMIFYEFINDLQLISIVIST